MSAVAARGRPPRVLALPGCQPSGCHCQPPSWPPAAPVPLTASRQAEIRTPGLVPTWTRGRGALAGVRKGGVRVFTHAT